MSSKNTKTYKYPFTKVKIKGIEYSLRGSYSPVFSSFRFTCKSMRNKGHFNIKKLLKKLKCEQCEKEINWYESVNTDTGIPFCLDCSIKKYGKQ